MSTVEDNFEKLPIVEGGPTHVRLDGELSGGYFCKICGGPDLADGEHNWFACEDNSELVGAIGMKNMTDNP